MTDHDEITATAPAKRLAERMIPSAIEEIARELEIVLNWEGDELDAFERDEIAATAEGLRCLLGWRCAAVVDKDGRRV